MEVHEVLAQALTDTEVQEVVRTNRKVQPTVFREAINGWDALKWTPSKLSDLFGDCDVKVRLHRKDEIASNGIVPWETECDNVVCTMDEFIRWLLGELQYQDMTSDHPLFEYDPNVYFGYADYMHFPEVFRSPRHLDVASAAVNWSRFLQNSTSERVKNTNEHSCLGRKSTLWVGSGGGCTPCHYDSYGYNLVAQIYGTKTWYLVPPTESAHMNPQRVPPYEESSVWSAHHMKKIIEGPSSASDDDHVLHNRLRKITQKVVLHSGDVLLVPRHWWHAVHSDCTSIAINTWVPTEEDYFERVKESVVRLITTGLMSWTDPPESTVDVCNNWVNSGEDISSASECLQYVNSAIDEWHKFHTSLKQDKHDELVHTCVDESAQENEEVHTNGNMLEDKKTSTQSDSCELPQQPNHTTDNNAHNTKSSTEKFQSRSRVGPSVGHVHETYLHASMRMSSDKRAADVYEYDEPVKKNRTTYDHEPSASTPSPVHTNSHTVANAHAQLSPGAHTQTNLLTNTDLRRTGIDTNSLSPHTMSNIVNAIGLDSVVSTIAEALCNVTGRQQ
eukprot:CFRG2798T1